MRSHSGCGDGSRSEAMRDSLAVAIHRFDAIRGGAARTVDHVVNTRITHSYRAARFASTFIAAQRDVHTSPRTAFPAPGAAGDASLFREPAVPTRRTILPQPDPSRVISRSRRAR